MEGYEHSETRIMVEFPMYCNMHVTWLLEIPSKTEKRYILTDPPRQRCAHKRQEEEHTSVKQVHHTPISGELLLKWNGSFVHFRHICVPC